MQIINYNGISKQGFANVVTVYFGEEKNSSTINFMLRSFVREGLPVLIKNFVPKPLINKLENFETLLQSINDVELPVECFENSLYNTKNQTTKYMTFSKFLNYIESDKSQERLYLVLDLINKYYKNPRRTISSFEGTLFEVFNENIRKFHLLSEANLFQRVLFFGCSTITEMHYHARQEAILNQVIGEKEFFLFPPGNFFYQMDPYPWYHKMNRRSQHEFHITDSCAFEKLIENKNLKFGVKAKLEPGDSLYIPIYWWHIVFGNSVSMSFSDFYDSSFRKKYLTFIGMRTRNHIPFYRS